ncbi:MAG TPA: hypothetical protein VGH80_10020 [Xanthomonadaceae bacterium]
MRTHLLAAAVLLVASGPALCAPAANAPISEQSLQAAANAIEAAARANDMDKANSWLASDCVFHVTSPDPKGGMRVDTMTRQQYVDDQAKAKTEGKNEVYKSTVPVVSIKDGKATASMRATDSQIEGGKSVTTVSDQVETFDLRNGRLMVTAVSVTVVSLTVDGNRLF